MALFSDARPPVSRRRRRVRVGWTILGVGIVASLGLSLTPAPYVIEQPGPVFDTLGEVTVDNELVPLISIPDETTYPTAGTLSMLTVNVVGNRDVQPNWLDILSAWSDPSRAVVPLDAVYPVGETIQQSNEQSAVDMQNSQKDAIAASLTELGYTLPSTLTVAAFSLDSPSEGILQAGDEILLVNDTKPVDVTQLRTIIAENGTSTPVRMEISRAGVVSDVEVTPMVSPQADTPIVGISVGADYQFPFDVKIQLEKVGGPSAGMMFALGIIDKLTEGELNGGKDIAGTGTISVSGDVGPIGGIRQKLYGARTDGAEYFLAPAQNCDEVTGHVPDGLTVFSVATLSQALTALKAVAAGSDLSTLPSCG
ncbi:MAG: ATP-dependent serine peptidase containing a PDZ domain protein [Burkholderiaceae bacterium]|nr:ATP-dependent serine peptidase containing a PDZ domain protein [Microbacteriaceae bacterium]